jgi:hypothetical protein
MVHHYIFAEELKKNEIHFAESKNERDHCLLSLIGTEKTLNDSEKIRKIQVSDLEITSKKIKCEIVLKGELEKRINDLDLRLERTKEIIENAILITSIVVDNNTCYNLANGLVDVNRDIVMKLLGLIDDETKIKNVCCVSMCCFRVICMVKIFYVYICYNFSGYCNGKNCLCLVKKSHFSMGAKHSVKFVFTIFFYL